MTCVAVFIILPQNCDWVPPAEKGKQCDSQNSLSRLFFARCRRPLEKLWLATIFLLLLCVFPRQDGGTALTVASQYGHSKVVDTLLKNGANVHDQLNVSTFFSLTPLASFRSVRKVMVSCTQCPSKWNPVSQVSADCWVRHDWHLAGLLSVLCLGKTALLRKHTFIKYY